MNSNNNNHSAHARTYDMVSCNVQLEWGRRLIEKRKWIGNETVMDACAGFSKQADQNSLQRAATMQIHSVDADSNMVEQAKANLSDY